MTVFSDGGKASQVRVNVVTRPWRVVYVLKDGFDPPTIKYTVEAESWNKARIKADEDMVKIMDFLSIGEDAISIESVTAVGGYVCP